MTTASSGPANSKFLVDVVIETPKGSRCKYHMDERSKEIRLKSVLPAGAVFPYDFGFVPKTRAEDGDPLDVLLFLDVPTFPGCVVSARLLGVIEVEQEDEGDVLRNDRVIAVATEARDYGQWQTLTDVDPHLLEEIEHFFRSYNEMKGKSFRILNRKGPVAARRLIKQAKKTSRRTSKGE